MRRAERVSDKCHSETFRGRKAKYEELEEKLYKWFEACHKVNLPVPPQMLRIKALKIAKQFKYLLESSVFPMGGCVTSKSVIVYCQ